MCSLIRLVAGSASSASPGQARYQASPARHTHSCEPAKPFEPAECGTDYRSRPALGRIGVARARDTPESRVTLIMIDRLQVSG